MKRLTIPVLVLASAGLALAACSSNNDNTAATDTTAAATDTAVPAQSQTIADAHSSQFLTDAIQGDNSEIKLGQLAVMQGSAKGVRDYGQMLVDDHGKHKAMVSKISTSMGVAVPDSVMPEANLEYDKLMGMSGADFDKEFVSFMASAHQKMIDMFQQEAGSTDPAPVTDLAKQTLPTLQKHLDAAKALQKS